jgi:5-methylcytosine-specific restriction endonuclease McrA
MRRFNLPKRIRRCRNVRATGEIGYARRVDEQRETERQPEAREVIFAQSISAGLRTYVLGQDDLSCGMCGVAPGDIDDLTGRKAKFHIGLIKDKDIGGKEELSNLKTLCTTCDEGARSITTPKPTGLWLLSQIRRAGQDEQFAALKWLRQKFKV